ncbi:SHOCT domain-containing protein [Paeniglutamicibacter kerguelensis]|uniref:SHOCT domain-containing protein n=1 Tax=Paeniglutamicibacter kerguelensis TaxID=254788 RepID=A0ABS4XC17_9MICC|nr:SHOCT domain-containing protein [Paeniglutamicibacter kerguelensis]MBP2386010.1 hypothetical protein [Paeniglutamicibacter kerguelensis]
MDFWENFWDLLWFTFWFYLVIAFVGVLFWIVGDLFRDKMLNGWFKALWIIGLVFLPIVGSLAYLIARGAGMAERNQRYTQAHHVHPAAGESPGDAITKARALLDAGSITSEEYELIKEGALT